MHFLHDKMLLKAVLVRPIVEYVRTYVRTNERTNEQFPSPTSLWARRTRALMWATSSCCHAAPSSAPWATGHVMAPPPTPTTRRRRQRTPKTKRKYATTGFYRTAEVTCQRRASAARKMAAATCASTACEWPTRASSSAWR